MAKYPIRIDLTKTKPKAVNRAAPPITQAALNSHSRRQGMEEASESLLLKKKAPVNVISTTTRLRETPLKGKK